MENKRKDFREDLRWKEIFRRGRDYERNMIYNDIIFRDWRERCDERRRICCLIDKDYGGDSRSICII